MATQSTPRPVAVKLGGAVITRKQRAAAVRLKVLTRLAEELAASRVPLVVLHGAGSYGHPGAKRFRLNDPPVSGDAATLARGAAIVSAEVRRLHDLVLRSLLDAGLPAWSVPPAAWCSQRARRLDHWDSRPFEEALGSGLVPVSFGDVVLDREWGFSILSADTIAVELVRAKVVDRVLFVSDVGGVYESMGPGRPKVIPTVTDSVVAGLATKGAGPDVTGGIRGKAQAMVEIAALGGDAGLISGLSDGLLTRALRGEPVYGSWSTPGRR